jgi:thiol-disulfide isomerase/thioredoxin
MLLLAAGGRRVVGRVRANAPVVRAALGILMALGAIAIYEGWETSLQTKIPSFATSVQNAIEGNSLAKRELAHLRGRSKAEQTAAAAAKQLGVYGRAPDFYGIAHWLNTPDDRPLTIGQLRGKVVLVDFWTYSCINCLRTLPHLEAWYRRYHDAGLQIVGVHTPEFAFEHDPGNVRAATKRLGIRYPVALDNDYATWNAYGNQAWPAEFVIDQQGRVRGGHIGEGDYGTTEQEFRALLAAHGRQLPRPIELPDPTPTGLRTPETYLGYIRIERYAGTKIRRDRVALYTLPHALGQSEVAYGGRWWVGSEHAISAAQASLALHFVARDVYVVLGGRGTVWTSVNGKPGRAIRVDGFRLYTAVSGPSARDATLRLRFPPGISAYSFTFG